MTKDREPIEQPIIMTASNGKKCHDGCKGQTRRPLKEDGTHWLLKLRKRDHLWVKEPWRVVGVWGSSGFKIEYGDEIIKRCRPPMGIDHKFRLQFIEDARKDKQRWRHARYMPRRFCRTLVELMRDPWVERVQNITYNDMVNEGIPSREFVSYADEWHHYRWCFIALWNSIYADKNVPGKGKVLGWDHNPEVACCEFRKVEGDE